MIQYALDLVSVSIVATYGYPLVRFAETADLKYLLVALGVLLADQITKLIKRATAALPHEWLKRPAGATACDLFCRKGPAAGKPGFPSGHMATAAAFVVLVYLLGARGPLFVAFAAAYLLLVAAARYYKKCHTPLQIVAGTLLGGAFAWAWWWAVVRHADKLGARP